MPAGSLRDPARLAALRRVALLDTPAEEAFDRLTRIAARALGVPVASITLVDADRQFFKSCVGLAEPWATVRETPLTHSFCRHVVEAGEPVVISSAPDEALVCGNPAIDELGVIAYAGVPLVTSDGHVLGTVAAVDSKPREWSDDDLEILRDLAAAAMGAIELRQVTNFQHAILDAVDEGVTVIDLDWAEVARNGRMREIVTDILGRPIQQSDFRARQLEIADQMTDRDRYLDVIAAIDEDEAYEGVDEWRLARTGRTLVRYTAPVRDALGGILGRIFTVRDVTAERQAEQMKSDVLATLSHELRTPLASILGFAELLDERDPDEQTRREYLGQIRTESVRLRTLVDGLLDLQSAGRGGLALREEQFELRELLRERIRAHAAAAPTHSIEPAWEGDGPLIVRGDRDRIGQAVSSLLENAVKYSPGGGDVRVRAEPRGDVVRLSVTDEGIGIAEADLGQVFTPFYRADAEDSLGLGGAGIGLALAREIVEGHGGRIGCESVLGAGSTFWLDLPLAG